MSTVFHINANELDEEFLNSLKSLYQNKQIEIIVSESDETAYLLNSEANRKRILEGNR